MLATGLLGACLCAPAHAADWSSANVQLLHGDGYDLEDNSKEVLTFEYAAGAKTWDVFFFMDIGNPLSSGTSHYGEFSPRLSLSAFTGEPLAFGIVKDTMIATTLEMGDGVRSYLVGVGFPLNLPGFAFADLNIYARKSYRDFVADQTDVGGQVTIDWLYPFKLGPLDMAFEGFADYAFGENGGSAPKEDNLITAPRLLVDVGKFIGAPGKFQVGVEYQAWINKFGVKGFDEGVAQAMVKWTF
jgi:nucleoside-specific outer membrane channel protein Tsx